MAEKLRWSSPSPPPQTLMKQGWKPYPHKVAEVEEAVGARGGQKEEQEGAEEGRGSLADSSSVKSQVMFIIRGLVGRDGEFRLRAWTLSL